MADAREARKILDAIPAADPFKALEDLDHWLESVRTWEGFRPEHRAQLAQLVDEAAQAHLRRLQRDYLSSPRLSRSHEYRLWAAIRQWYRRGGEASSRWPSCPSCPPGGCGQLVHTLARLPLP